MRYSTIPARSRRGCWYTGYIQALSVPDMTEADPQKKEDAIAFLKSHRVGVLSTLAEDGRPRARTIYFASDTDFNIYFLTFSNTRKAEDLSKHPQAAFTVSVEEKPQ